MNNMNDNIAVTVTAIMFIYQIHNIAVNILERLLCILVFSIKRNIEKAKKNYLNKRKRKVKQTKKKKIWA